MARPLEQSDPWFEAPHTASPGGNFAGLERIGDARIPRRALLPRAHPTPTESSRPLPYPPTIDRWWRISGDPGYLARFAAPANSPATILATLPASDPEVIRKPEYVQ